MSESNTNSPATRQRGAGGQAGNNRGGTNSNNQNRNNGNNRGGRNRNNNRSNNNRNNPHKEQGATEELKHHIFDCSSRKNIEACNVSLKQVAIYVGKEYGKNADSVKYVVQHLKDPDLMKPDELDNIESANKMEWFECQEKTKRWMDRQDSLVTGKKKLYTLVWGQCTKLMQAELEACTNFEEMEDQQDPIALIKAIKGISYNFRDQKYLPGSMWRAYKALFNTTQREDEDLKAYYDRFQNAVEVLENYGADIGALSRAYEEEFMTSMPEMTNDNDAITHKALKEALATDEKEIESLKKVEKDKFLGYGILANCDKKKYGNLVEDLDNAFTFGDNKYPDTQQKSYEYAMNYKKYKPKSQQQNRQRDGLAFATAGRGGRGNGGRGSGNRPRRCYGDRCYGNCDNSQCTAPGLANRNSNQNVTNATVDNDTSNESTNNSTNNDSNNNNSSNSNTNNNSNNSNNNNGGGRRGGRQFLTIMEEEGQEYLERNFSFHTRGIDHSNVLGIDHSDVLVDSNEDKNECEYIFRHQDKKETNKNLMKWLLLDTASTTHLLSNKNLVSNIRQSNTSQGVLSTGGELEVNQEADLDNIGTVPFTDDGMANLLSMAKLVDQGYRIYIDTDVEDAILVFTPDNQRTIKFERSANGLYFHDTENRQVSMMNSQYENSLMYTRRQVHKAREARNLYQMMGYPSVNDFKNAIKH